MSEKKTLIAQDSNVIRGEVAELKVQIESDLAHKATPEHEKSLRDKVTSVVKYMTSGVDVSSLFTTMIMVCDLAFFPFSFLLSPLSFLLSPFSFLLSPLSSLFLFITFPPFLSFLFFLFFLSPPFLFHSLSFSFLFVLLHTLFPRFRLSLLSSLGFSQPLTPHCHSPDSLPFVFLFLLHENRAFLCQPTDPHHTALHSKVLCCIACEVHCHMRHPHTTSTHDIHTRHPHTTSTHDIHMHNQTNKQTKQSTTYILYPHKTNKQTARKINRQTDKQINK